MPPERELIFVSWLGVFIFRGVYVLVGSYLHFLLADERTRHILLQACNSRILSDVENAEDSVARRSSVRSANPFLSTREEFCFYLLAVKKNLSGAARRYAEDLFKKLCSARSVKSGDTEYLSLFASKDTSLRFVYSLPRFSTFSSTSPISLSFFG